MMDTAKRTLNHANSDVLATGKGEARHRKFEWLKIGGGQTYDRSAACSLRVVTSVKAQPAAQACIDRRPLCILYKCYLAQ
jgi:hypothetical protein